MANGPPQVVVPGQGWVDVASRVVVQVGFPVVVAAVLLWYLLTRFQENMNTITTRMAANTDVVTRLIIAEDRTLAELEAQSGELHVQTAELKMQTAQLTSQGQVMAAIAKDAQTLVDIRAAELKLLERLQHEHPAVKR
jgi:hypothetical protein